MSTEGPKQIPRPEYPRPQMVRDKWINLNGEWEFEIDQGRSGIDRKLFDKDKLEGRITVPFCPESSLSGVGIKDFMNSVWYKKTVVIPDEWTDARTLLHFGAVDYTARIWINGKSAGTHRGGYSSFSFDITDHIIPGINNLTIMAEDDTRSGLQPTGKQSERYDSYACMYTRTTGIWQTVWLESVPCGYISDLRLTPDIHNSTIMIEAFFKELDGDCSIFARTSFNGVNTGSRKAAVIGGYVSIIVELASLHLWEPGIGRLYDLEISLFRDGKETDRVKSYFGMRNIELRNNISILNGKPVFQRLVLDQGFYPEGIYTAPRDDDLKKDIEIAMEAGYNGARLHEKVFESRYLYWADKMGFLVWGEYPNWGLDISSKEALGAVVPEWLEVLKRDYSHPSIIGWCPFNETQADQDNEVIRVIFDLTKQIDPTRIVIDTSGWAHVKTDMLDVHDYDQDISTFKARYDLLVEFKQLDEKNKRNPMIQDMRKVNFVSEYGGIWWSDRSSEGWGYGDRPETMEEFLYRFKGLTDALLDNPNICAFCYTQLYDVEQEQNGIYKYDRSKKFDIEIIKKINTRKAAIER